MGLLDGFWFWLGKVIADLFILFAILAIIFAVGLYVSWVDSKRVCPTCKGLGGREGWADSAACPNCFKRKIK